jgi:hypothetical protein
MENPESTTQVQAELSELREQYESLRHLVFSSMVVLLIISGALNLYLLRQWRFTKNDLATVRPQAMQLITDYNKTVTGMQDFLKRLSDYSRTHPDFAPIANKYRLNDVTAKPAAPTAPTAPAPAAPAKK